MHPRPASLAGILLLAAAACSSERRASAPGPAAGVGGSSAWELVFEREVAGNLDLYVIPAGGGAERRLTDAPGEDGLARHRSQGKLECWNIGMLE